MYFIFGLCLWIFVLIDNMAAQEGHKRRVHQVTRFEGIAHSSFFDKYYFPPEQIWFKSSPWKDITINYRSTGGYSVKRHGEKLSFPSKIGLVWTKEMADRLMQDQGPNKPPLNEDDLKDLRKALRNFTQHLEVMKTTQAEVFEKIANLERNDPLIKYMKKVVNMIKVDIRAFRSLLVEPYHTELAKQIDAFMVFYEETKNYYRKPGPLALQRFHGVVAALNH